MNKKSRKAKPNSSQSQRISNLKFLFEEYKNADTLALDELLKEYSLYLASGGNPNTDVLRISNKADKSNKGARNYS